MEFIEGREGVWKGGDSEWEGRRKERRTVCLQGGKSMKYLVILQFL